MANTAIYFCCPQAFWYTGTPFFLQMGTSDGYHFIIDSSNFQMMQKIIVDVTRLFMLFRFSCCLVPNPENVSTRLLLYSKSRKQFNSLLARRRTSQCITKLCSLRIENPIRVFGARELCYHSPGDKCRLGAVFLPRGTSSSSASRTS